MIGQRIDALADDADVAMAFDRLRHFSGKRFAIDRQRRAGGDTVLVGAAHDERVERAHLLMEEADRIVLGIVRAKAVRADHFGKSVAFVRGGGIAAASHHARRR